MNQKKILEIMTKLEKLNDKKLSLVEESVNNCLSIQILEELKQSRETREVEKIPRL